MYRKRVALGNNALLETQSGYENIAVGYFALGRAVGDINNNVVIGDRAAEWATGGNHNVIIGDSAGLSNSASNGVFIGSESGSSNTGIGNVFIGSESGYNNTSGTGNVFSGYQSGIANITGVNKATSRYSTGTSCSDTLKYLTGQEPAVLMLFSRFYNRGIRKHACLLVYFLQSISLTNFLKSGYKQSCY